MPLMLQQTLFWHARQQLFSAHSAFAAGLTGLLQSGRLLRHACTELL